MDWLEVPIHFSFSRAKLSFFPERTGVIQIVDYNFIDHCVPGTLSLLMITQGSILDTSTTGTIQVWRGGRGVKLETFEKKKPKINFVGWQDTRDEDKCAYASCYFMYVVMKIRVN